MSRILIVDDDDSFRTMLRLTLLKRGYDAEETTNGREALALQETNPAELLLTDLIMPDQEGLETIQEFRRRYPAVKIIAMSGGGRINARDYLVIAKMLGAARTFAKPFSNDELVAAIDELLVKSPARTAAQQ